jgi:cobalt/nickel transport system permease protein
VNRAFLDPYRDQPSAVHALDARVKLVVALAFIVAISLTPSQAWPVFAAYLLAIAATALLARLRPASMLARSMLAVPFALLAGLGLLYVREGTPLLMLAFGPWRITVTDVGVQRLVSVVLRAWLSILVSVALASVAPFLEIVRAMQDLGLPRVLTATILLMYRYVGVLVDESQRLIRAREARSGELSGRHVKGLLPWRAQVAARMVGTLFLRTYERSERIYHAMLARGFAGEVRTLRSAALPRRDVVLGGMALALLTGMAVLARLR